MNTSLYAPGQSLLHRLDPRPKLLLLLATLLLALAGTRPFLPVLMLAAALIGAWNAGAWSALHRFRGLILTVFTVSVVIWSLLPLLGGLTASLQHLIASSSIGLTTGLKLAAMIVWSVLILATTPIEALTLGLLRLGLPYPAAFAFSTALRLVPALVGTAVTVIQAQKSRGLDLDSGSPLVRARKHISLLVPVIALTLRSTNTYAMALEARAFRAYPTRTSLVTLSMNRIDWAATFLALGLLALAIRLWWTGAVT
jgi:energy-coupling factor transport system permease protein